MNPQVVKNSEKDRIFSDPRTVRRVFRKVAVVSLLAFFLAALLISVANDLYAFVKPDNPVTFTLSEPCSLDSLSRQLAENGVIENPYIFSHYAAMKGKQDTLEAFRGTVSLNSSMSYREILLAFSGKSA